MIKPAKLPAKWAAMTLISATALSLAACDSKAENQIERQAEAIDESYEAEADLKESLAQGAPTEEAAEAEADKLRDRGEAIKDDLEDKADELDTAPQ
ncbi:MAG: hypothetical protein WA842_10310 [Croceibacterium sp.]